MVTFFSGSSWQRLWDFAGFRFLAVFVAFALVCGESASRAAPSNGTQTDEGVFASEAFVPADTVEAASAGALISGRNATSQSATGQDIPSQSATGQDIPSQSATGQDIPRQNATGANAPDISNDLQELQPEPEDAVLSEEANLTVIFGIQAHRVMKDEAHLASVRAAWRTVQARMEHEPPFATMVKGMPATIQTQWAYLEKNFKSMDAAKQLRAVNGFFNHFPSVDDKVLYGVDEYWATPSEFINKYGGDCEDYAIIKYRALLSLGWPAERMWIVGVDNATDLSQRHAVLVIRSEDMYFVLDNLSRPKYLIMPDKYYSKYYVPLFAVNDLGLWRFNTVPKVKKQALR